jgi:type I restriction enzyme S subunit
MKLETFFEKFDQFADAPDAVAKMRELVLQLAVQGKIVDQDANDESAAKLLQGLISFKLANPLSGRSGRSKEGPVEVEATSDGLPANWVKTTIGEVLYVIRGASPRPKGDPQYFSETRTPYHWVKISDIRKHGQNGLLMDTDEFLTEAGMRKSVLLPKGTLVLTNSATIGVPIVLGIEGCCIHDGYLAFPNFPHDLLSQKFLLYLFHTLKKHAERNARGLAQLNLNTDLVRSFPFGLPPLAEQKRIVAKVDELMALCDRLEAQQQERETRHAALARASLARFADAPTPANLTFLFHPSYAISPADLRKSILTLAVQGKLVRFEAENDAQTVGDHIEFQNGYAFKSQWFKPDGMRLCRNVNVSHGVVDWRESAFVDDDIAKEFERFALSEGDIVLSLDRPLITTGLKVARIRKSDLPCLLLQRVAKPVPKHDQLDMYYFLLWLNSSEFVDSIDPGRSNGVPHISTRQVQLLPFVLPPLAEQRRIVAKVEQLMALVDALETQLAASRTTAENLLAAVVAELTEGTHASPAC